MRRGWGAAGGRELVVEEDFSYVPRENDQCLISSSTVTVLWCIYIIYIYFYTYICHIQLH